MPKVGERVGAISHGTGEEMFIFGYGVYEGDFEPPRPPMGMTKEEWDAISMELSGKVLPYPPNPRIKLDDGKIVWGCECWWAPEENVKASIGNRKVTIVDIDQVRKDAGAE